MTLTMLSLFFLYRAQLCADGLDVPHSAQNLRMLCQKAVWRQLFSQVDCISAKCIYLNRMVVILCVRYPFTYTQHHNV
jgi:hypothetical protein